MWAPGSQGLASDTSRVQTPGSDGASDSRSSADGARRGSQPSDSIGLSTVKRTRCKTGCIPCRQRKKKCDESKPECRACEKNNIVCHYEKRRAVSHASTTRTESFNIPLEVLRLSAVTDGIDNELDRMFFAYFTNEVTRKIFFAHRAAAFAEAVHPIAIQHGIVMHSLQYLAASFWNLDPRLRSDAAVERQLYHSIHAVVVPRTGADLSGSARSALVVPLTATALLLHMQEIFFGKTVRVRSPQ
jgi:hypothetical protein